MLFSFVFDLRSRVIFCLIKMAPMGSIPKAGTLGFRIYRYVFACAIYGLSPRLLERYFSSGSMYANILMLIMTPASKSSRKFKTEHQLINKVKDILDKGFQPNSLMVALLYLLPYEFDLNLSLFDEAASHSELAPIYIRFLFNTDLFYLSSADYDNHMYISDLAMIKMRILLENSSFIMRERLAMYLGYYVGGNVPLIGYSDQRTYQCNKLLLLLDYLKIAQPYLVNLPEYVPSVSLASKKRVGLIRMSLAIGGERDMVFSVVSNPPEQIDLFLFVFDLDEKQYQLFTECYPWFLGKIIQLNMNDLSASLVLIRQHQLDFFINTSPLTGKFINEISILLALRVAPAQAMLISDVVTSGIPNMDYFIMPQPFWHKGLQNQFSEKLLMIQGMNEIILHRENNTMAVNAELSFSRDEILFGSNAHIMKLSPDVLNSWAQVLREVNNSQIMLMPFPNEYLKAYRGSLEQTILAACSNAGVNPARFVIMDVSGKADVCKNISSCDIYLDTFPYSGTISIYDILSLEKPMVTLKGELYRNRLASTILEALDLEKKMVANSREEYVALAVEQAQSKLLRDTLHHQIRNNIATHSHLCHPDLSSESFYQALIEVLSEKSVLSSTACQS